MEIFLYYCGTLEIITREYGNSPILSWDPGNYHQASWKYSWIIMEAWEISHKLLRATTTKIWDYSDNNNVWYVALPELNTIFYISTKVYNRHRKMTKSAYCLVIWSCKQQCRRESRWTYRSHTVKKKVSHCCSCDVSEGRVAHGPIHTMLAQEGVPL